MQLTTSPADQLDPDVSTRWIVYEDESAGNWDIAAYDGWYATTRRVTANAADQVDPAIDGDTVVFADRRNGNWDIYSFDLSRKTLRRLTTSKAAQTKPDIGRGLVVYQDHRNGNWDIYAYNLATGKERRLTTNGRNQTAPSIGESRSVVYQDDRNGAADVYLFDLKTDTNRRVTNDPAAQTMPSMGAGHAVVWQDARADAGDVYGTSLQYPDMSFGWDTDNPSATPGYDSTLRFVGTLRVAYGSVGGLQAVVSGTGGTRKVEVVPVDEGFGRFVVTLRHVVRKVSLRASFTGTARYLPDRAGTVTVKPKALLTRPSFAKLPFVFRPLHGQRHHRLGVPEAATCRRHTGRHGRVLALRHQHERLPMEPLQDGARQGDQLRRVQQVPRRDRPPSHDRLGQVQGPDRARGRRSREDGLELQRRARYVATDLGDRPGAPAGTAGPARLTKVRTPVRGGRVGCAAASTGPRAKPHGPPLLTNGAAA